MNKTIFPIVLLATALTAPAAINVALAQTKDAAPKSDTQPAAKPALVDAEIKKIDRDARKITLKHSEIKHLDMPPMTMVFHVKDEAMLANVKVGDKVKVGVEQTKSGYLVNAIEAAK